MESTGLSRSGSLRRQPEPEQVKERQRLKRVGEYVLGDILGEGSFGQVREGLYVPRHLKEDCQASLQGQGSSDKLKFGQRVAVKIIKRRLLTRKIRNGQENLKREINCLKRLKHQNVIQLYETIDDQAMDKIYLVFELANFLSLQDILDLIHKSGGEGTASYKPAPFEKLKNLQNLFYQLTLGLMHCHSRGVVHRDIKPSNLQLTLDGVLKIIDFGVAELLERYSELDGTEKFAGTPAFQPPEVARGCRSFSATKVDVWAAGVTLYVMATGVMPFSGDTTDELYATISTGMYLLPDDLPEDLQNLLSRVMNPDPEARATLDSVLKHPWLAGQDSVPALQLPQSIKDAVSKKESLLERYMEQDSDDSEGGDQDTSPETFRPLHTASTASAASSSTLPSMSTGGGAGPATAVGGDGADENEELRNKLLRKPNLTKDPSCLLQ